MSDRGEGLMSAARRYDADCYRLFGDEGAAGPVIGFVLRMSDKRWGLFDADDRRLTPMTWPRPTDAIKAFARRRGLQPLEDG